MADIMQSGFLTRSEGNDSDLISVKFNSGTSKRMRYARKRCLDDVHKWSKSLHRLPTETEWRENPQMFTMDTIKELFGSFDAMLSELEKRKQPKTRHKSEVKVSNLKKEKVDEVLLGLPEEEPGKQADTSKPKPEINLATPCCKLVNTLGYSFDIGHVHIEANHDDWRAVIETTQRSTAQSDIVVSRQLKLTQDITGQLVDFPAPQEGIFYLIDAKLYHEMDVSWCPGRYDFIPVYRSGNYPSDFKPPADPDGLYVRLKS